MGRYVEVVVNTQGLYQVGTRAWGIIGVVGRGVGSGFSLNTAYVILSPADAKDLFGETSALYNSILLAFSNGATQVIAVAAEATAQTAELFDGDGTTKEFTLASFPTQPMGAVLIGATPKVEGTDFYVDYGNKKVIFYVAPATGTDNVSVVCSTHTVGQLNSALTALENEDVQLLCPALIFDATLLARFLAHTTAMKDSYPRIGIYILKSGETATTTKASVESEHSILIAHKSLLDVAAAAAGAIASYKPWEDLTMKPVIDIQMDGKFTPTQIAAFDVAQIVTMYDPPRLTGNAVVFSTGWTLDSTGTLIFIDQVRTADHFASVLEYGITNPNVIAKMRMNRNGLRELDSYISSLLNPWVNTGAIDGFRIVNPARTLFELANPSTAQIAEMQTLQASRQLKDAYRVLIRLIYSGTIIFVGIDLSLGGGA